MVSYYHQVITHPHQSLCSHSLPSTMSSHTLLPSLHFTSFSLQMHHKCITNASPMHHQPSPTLSHPSCLHRIIIISSPLPITYHHQSLPLTPYNTPNPSISLPTLPIVSQILSNLNSYPFLTSTHPIDYPTTSNQFNQEDGINLKDSLDKASSYPHSTHFILSRLQKIAQTIPFHSIPYKSFSFIQKE